MSDAPADVFAFGSMLREWRERMAIPRDIFAKAVGASVSRLQAIEDGAMVPAVRLCRRCVAAVDLTHKAMELGRRSFFSTYSRTTAAALFGEGGSDA